MCFIEMVKQTSESECYFQKSCRPPVYKFSENIISHHSILRLAMSLMVAHCDKSKSFLFQKQVLNQLFILECFRKNNVASLNFEETLLKVPRFTKSGKIYQYDKENYLHSFFFSLTPLFISQHLDQT